MNSYLTIENGVLTECDKNASGNIIIPDEVVSIGDYAFWNCSSLTSIHIPSSVTSIGDRAFGGCSSLTSVTVSPDNHVYDSRDNCNAIIESVSNKLIAGCKTTIIPDSVTEIGAGAFGRCEYLEAIAIPSSVITIGNSAFYGCSSLTSVIIPEGVREIGKQAFHFCLALRTVMIPSSVIWIGYAALFDTPSLVSLTVSPDNQVYDSRDNCNALIESASNKLIVGCQTTVIPESVTEIGAKAFIGIKSLTSIYIPAAVRVIGQDAFYRCSSLTSITVSPDNQVYDSRDNCNALIESASNMLIVGCQTTVIPESVTEIGAKAFIGIKSLTSIYIPAAVRVIGQDAFYRCSSLTSITVSPDNQVYDSRDNCNALIESASNKLIVGCQTTVIPESVTEIDESAWEMWKSLESIRFPDTITGIEQCLQCCTSLTHVSLPISLIEGRYDNPMRHNEIPTLRSIEIRL